MPKLFTININILTKKQIGHPWRESDIPGGKSDIPGEESDIPGEKSDIPGEKSDIPGEESDIPGDEASKKPLTRRLKSPVKGFKRF